jgi:hypothetical protein
MNKLHVKKAEPAKRNAYAVLDANGKWHKSKEGALLSYDNKTDGLTGMRLHEGSRVIKCSVFFDGETEVSDVEES